MECSSLLLISKNLKANIGFWISIAASVLFIFFIIRYASKGIEWLSPLIYYYVNLNEQIKIISPKIINPLASPNTQRNFMSFTQRHAHLHSINSINQSNDNQAYCMYMHKVKQKILNGIFCHLILSSIPLSSSKYSTQYALFSLKSIMIPMNITI